MIPNPAVQPVRLRPRAVHPLHQGGSVQEGRAAVRESSQEDPVVSIGRR